jgi:hypothetical protein
MPSCRSEWVPSCRTARRRSHSAQNVLRAGPSRTSAAHSMSSSQKTPTQRHAFRGRPWRHRGIGAGGTGTPGQPGGGTPWWRAGSDPGIAAILFD